MKLLIATSFRPFGISKNNDLYQLMFLNSLKNFNCDLTICVTQFDDSGVENILRESGLRYIYNNVSKNNLPIGKKYSNHKTLFWLSTLKIRLYEFHIIKDITHNLLYSIDLKFLSFNYLDNS